MTYEAAINKLSKYSNKRLSELLAAEKNNPGWTVSRSVYLVALKHVASKKGV